MASGPASVPATRARGVRGVRRDAQARREALLEAAAACFAERGYGVPLEDIAERAGVGRGTLYRNFADRMALVLAMFAREVTRLDAVMAQDQPFRDTLAAMVRSSRRASALFVRLSTEMPPTGADHAAFEAMRQRVEQLMRGPVERARQAGELRPEVAAADVVLALRMVNALVLPFHTPDEADQTISRAIDLLLRGLGR